MIYNLHTVVGPQSFYSEGDVCVFKFQNWRADHAKLHLGGGVIWNERETPLPNCLHISHMNCCLAKNGQAAVYEPCCILPNGAHPDPAG